MCSSSSIAFELAEFWQFGTLIERGCSCHRTSDRKWPPLRCETFDKLSWRLWMNRWAAIVRWWSSTLNCVPERCGWCWPVRWHSGRRPLGSGPTRQTSCLPSIIAINTWNSKKQQSCTDAYDVRLGSWWAQQTAGCKWHHPQQTQCHSHFPQCPHGSQWQLVDSSTETRPRFGLCSLSRQQANLNSTNSSPLYPSPKRISLKTINNNRGPCISKRIGSPIFCSKSSTASTC